MVSVSRPLDPPASASQSVGITGVSHGARAVTPISSASPYRRVCSAVPAYERHLVPVPCGPQDPSRHTNQKPSEKGLRRTFISSAQGLARSRYPEGYGRSNHNYNDPFFFETESHSDRQARSSSLTATSASQVCKRFSCLSLLSSWNYRAAEKVSRQRWSEVLGGLVKTAYTVNRLVRMCLKEEERLKQRLEGGRVCTLRDQGGQITCGWEFKTSLANMAGFQWCHHSSLLELPGSSHPCTSASRTAGITDMSHHTQLIFKIFLETGFYHVGQAGLALLTSDNLPALASQSARIIDIRTPGSFLKMLSHCQEALSSLCVRTGFEGLLCAS
ncbi:hypothetical protein AAY473_034601 [Plecturocebus cupreus]